MPAKPGQSADPKPTAGKQGTQITVEDLFYNVPTRRRAFRSSSEEYAKILDLIGRYAVHCTGVAFSCKKHGESSLGISVPSNASIIDRIRQIHNSAVANELIKLKASSDTLGFKAEGWISNANYSVKRLTLLLFINRRSVESSPIKKAIEQTYSAFLPKGGHPFVYLSLEIEPHRLDVNVHPTKREVRFLHEEEIIEVMCENIRDSLGNVDTSRTFMTQSLLPTAKVPVADIQDSATGPQTPGENSMFKTPARESTTQKPNENNLVRTDSRARKITSMLPFTPHKGASEPNITDEPTYEETGNEPSHCRLTSIKELRAEVREEMHNGLTDILASHTFIGIADGRRRIAALQSGVKLYLVDYGMLANEYFLPARPDRLRQLRRHPLPHAARPGRAAAHRRPPRRSRRGQARRRGLGRRDRRRRPDAGRPPRHAGRVLRPRRLGRRPPVRHPAARQGLHAVLGQAAALPAASGPLRHLGGGEAVLSRLPEGAGVLLRARGAARTCRRRVERRKTCRRSLNLRRGGRIWLGRWRMSCFQRSGRGWLLRRAY